MVLFLHEQRAFPAPTARTCPALTLPLKGREQERARTEQGLAPIRQHLTNHIQYAWGVRTQARQLLARLATQSVLLDGQRLSPDDLLLLRGSLVLTMQQQEQSISDAQSTLDALEDERRRR